MSENEAPKDDKGLVKRLSELEEQGQEREFDYERLFRELQRPIRVVGADYPGIGDTVTITSTTLVNVGGPVKIEVPEGAEAVITLQGRINVSSTGASALCLYEILRGDIEVSQDLYKEAAAPAPNRTSIYRTVVERLGAGVYTYRLRALVGSGQTAEFVGIQWQIEMRPARRGVLNKE